MKPNSFSTVSQLSIFKSKHPCTETQVKLVKNKANKVEYENSTSTAQSECHTGGEGCEELFGGISSKATLCNPE